MLQFGAFLWLGFSHHLGWECCGYSSSWDFSYVSSRGMVWIFLGFLDYFLQSSDTLESRYCGVQKPFVFLYFVCVSVYFFSVLALLFFPPPSRGLVLGYYSMNGPKPRSCSIREV